MFGCSLLQVFKAAGKYSDGRVAFTTDRYRGPDDYFNCLVVCYLAISGGPRGAKGSTST